MVVVIRLPIRSNYYLPAMHCIQLVYCIRYIYACTILTSQMSPSAKVKNPLKSAFRYIWRDTHCMNISFLMQYQGIVYMQGPGICHMHCTTVCKVPALT